MLYNKYTARSKDVPDIISSGRRSDFLATSGMPEARLVVGSLGRTPPHERVGSGGARVRLHKFMSQWGIILKMSRLGKMLQQIVTANAQK